MFDWLKNPIIKRLITRGVRVVLAALAAWLVKKGLASADEAAKLMEELAPGLIAAAWFGYELASERATKQAEKKISVALNMPAGSSRDDLAKVMDVKI